MQMEKPAAVRSRMAVTSHTPESNRVVTVRRRALVRPPNTFVPKCVFFERSTGFALACVNTLSHDVADRGIEIGLAGKWTRRVRL